MARVYKVVCPVCGEVIPWCKYDPPLAVSPCPVCGFKLAVEDGGSFADGVKVFGVGATSVEVKEHSKAVLRRTVEKILDGNYWLSGRAETDEGDPLAGLENREILCKISKVSSPEELYRQLKNYAGTFKYGPLLFINHPAYGCFVYLLRKLENYVEHLTIDSMTPESFKQAVEKLCQKR